MDEIGLPTYLIHGVEGASGQTRDLGWLQLIERQRNHSINQISPLRLLAALFRLKKEAHDTIIRFVRFSEPQLGNSGDGEGWGEGGGGKDVYAFRSHNKAHESSFRCRMQ